MILELTPNTHPILHNKIRPCSVNLDRHFVAKTLIENMLHYDGVGLAANQIGMEVRAFAMVRDLENNEIMVCFNPKIVKKYNEVVNFEEGCLSFPDKIVRVDRPDRIVVQYEDKDKKIHKIKLNGFAARVFQHELDHLEGIDFTQRSSK
mgnify:CR=1 FL=1